MGICTITDCGRRSIARGWCTMHYQRWQKHGSALWGPRTEADRFLESFVIQANGCWIWQQSTLPQGYGLFRVGSTKDGTRRREYAHRTAWRLFVGAIPSDLFVCHHCDNPRCVNPGHLFIGTAQDNANDMMKKGRHKLRSIPQPRSTETGQFISTVTHGST